MKYCKYECSIAGSKTCCYECDKREKCTKYCEEYKKRISHSDCEKGFENSEYIVIGGKEYVKSKAIITRVKHVASKQYKCIDCESHNITEYCNGQYKEERYYCGSCGKRAEENNQNYCGYCGIKFQKIVEV